MEQPLIGTSGGMNRDLLVRLRDFLKESIEAWGEEGALTEEAILWLKDIEEDLESMPEVVNEL